LIDLLEAPIFAVFQPSKHVEDCLRCFVGG